MDYFLVSLIIYLSAILYQYAYVIACEKGNQIKLLISVSIYILLVIFIGLRFETGGPDWIAYQQFFDYIEPASRFYASSYWAAINSHGFEPLFKVYASVLKIFSKNYIFLNFVSSVVTLFVLFNFYHKVTIYPMVAVFLYFCSYSLLGDMTVVRQLLAVSIFILSLDDVKNRNLHGFFTKIFFAILFHFSALILVLFYFFYPLLSRWRFVLSVVAVLIVSFVFFGGFTKLIIEALSIVFSFNDALTFKLSQYLKDAASTDALLGVGFLERTVLFVMCIFFKNKIISRFGSYGELIICLFIFNYIVSLVFLDFSVFYLRFRYYFVFCVPVLYTYLLALIKPRIIPFFGFLIYGFLWIYLSVYSAPQMYVPYQNYIGELLGFGHVDRERMIEDGYE